MTHLEIAFVFVVSYVVGGIPTGYIIGRMNGIDIRKVGSGNPGTANVLRNLGKAAGLLTLLVDFMKGFLPTSLCAFIQEAKTFPVDSSTFH